MNTKLKRIAMIGTGGTISSRGADPLELVNYIDRGLIYTIDEVVERTPDLHQVCEPVVVPFMAVGSTEVRPEHWLNLVSTINDLARTHDDIGGVVITHGTASLEETAYFLNLTVKLDVPVVVVGAQRPFTGLSSDAQLNLVNAARVASSDDARGLGVLVCLNGEVHAAREATKTSTFRMQTFRAPEFGVLGHADHDSVNFYRKPIRDHAPTTEFDVSGHKDLPRVDIVYCHSGVDGAAVDAFTAAGAKGIVVAGFAPGLVTQSLLEALNRAAEKGVVIVQSSRAGSGRVTPVKTKQATGSVTADNLNPQKARVLTMLSLTVASDAAGVQSRFDRY